MSEHYFCPHHGTDCFDVEDDLGNFCDFGRVHGVEGDRCMNPYE